MFKKWKERDSDKDKKDKKEQAKREASRGSKEKKSFTDVLAGFESSSKPTEESQIKEKSHSRRSVSEKRRQERFRREELFRQQTAAEFGKSIPSTGLKNGSVNSDGLGSPAGQVQDEHIISSGDKRPSQYDVTVSRTKEAGNFRENKFERQESIKVASGEEVTINIGLSSEIMAGLDTGTRNFLVKNDGSSSNASNLKGVDLSLPELSSPPVDSGRILHIKRLPIGDFGFALRRSTVDTEKGSIVHLVEPLGDDKHTGLMPGDRLVEVNGQNVENATREEIIDMISASGNEVVLRVMTVPELADFSKRSMNAGPVNSNQVLPGGKGTPFLRSSSMKTKRSKV